MESKLPDITEFSRTYLGVDPITELVPVFPTAHYAMGGVPTNVDTEVLRDNEHIVPGLYAAGEAACVSVHGANRLGTNSLLDINVFGRRAGIAAAEYANSVGHAELPDDPQGATIALVERLRSASGNEHNRTAQGHAGHDGHECAGIPHGGHLEAGPQRRTGAQGSLRKRVHQDKGTRYNTDHLGDRLGFLLDLAEVTVVSALERKESAEVTLARITQIVTTLTSCATPWRTSPERQRRRLRAPGLQASDDDPVRADGAQVLMAAVIEQHRRRTYRSP